jgi:hypothetical protein
MREIEVNTEPLIITLDKSDLKTLELTIGTKLYIDDRVNITFYTTTQDTFYARLNSRSPKVQTSIKTSRTTDHSNIEDICLEIADIIGGRFNLEDESFNKVAILIQTEIEEDGISKTLMEQ